jgi:glucose/arabinose dehydrogenase
VRAGDDIGFPCCATHALPFPDSPKTIDCSQVAEEIVPIFQTDIPFGFDFAPSTWPAPWSDRVYVALHGAFGTWIGARIVSLGVDAAGQMLPGGTRQPDGGAGDTGSARDFATGWDDGQLDRGRPADITFANDGRMFVAQDNGPNATQGDGIIVWVSPIDLPKP